MKNSFLLACFLAILPLFIVSCDKGTENARIQNVEVKNARITIIDVKPVNKGNESYLGIIGDFDINPDSTWHSGDTLFFSYTTKETKADGRLVAHSDFTVSAFELNIHYNWIREWYDYSKPKNDPGYHRSDAYTYNLKMVTDHMASNNGIHNYEVKSGDLTNTFYLYYKSTVRYESGGKSYDANEGTQFDIHDTSAVVIKLEL
jgi:hypothetical protein